MPSGCVLACAVARAGNSESVRNGRPAQNVSVPRVDAAARCHSAALSSENVQPRTTHASAHTPRCARRQAEAAAQRSKPSPSSTAS